MKKKTAILLLIGIALVGQIVNFYATNLLLGSIPALTYGVVELELLAAIPAFILALDLTMGMMTVGRLYRYPRHKKEYVMRNGRILCIFSAIGLIASVMCGTVLYGSFLAPYPFPGYTLLGILIHGALLGYSLYSLPRWKKSIPEDPPSHDKTAQLILRTFLLPILIFIAQNRGGALLWSVTYLHLPTLYMTYPFYLSLLLPLALLFHAELFEFGFYRTRPKRAIRNTVILMVITVVSCTAVILEGISNTRFISVISPALGIERLITMPVDTVIHFILCLLLSVWLLLYSLRKYRESKDLPRA